MQKQNDNVMKTKLGIFLAMGLVLFTISSDASAQCAMCKAVVETNLEAGGSKGSGLNDGILYLMAFPYLAAVGFTILYFLQKKKTRNSLTE